MGKNRKKAERMGKNGKETEFPSENGRKKARRARAGGVRYSELNHSFR